MASSRSRRLSRAFHRASSRRIATRCCSAHLRWSRRRQARKAASTSHALTRKQASPRARAEPSARPRTASCSKGQTASRRCAVPAFRKALSSRNPRPASRQRRHFRCAHASQNPSRRWSSSRILRAASTGRPIMWPTGRRAPAPSISGHGSRWQMATAFPSRTRASRSSPANSTVKPAMSNPSISVGRFSPAAGHAGPPATLCRRSIWR